MFFWLLLLFFTVPLVEIYVLLEVGGVIGVLPTIALVVLTAVIGAGLIRAQGLATLARVRGELDRGELPAVGIIEAALLLVAGALLLTPGFVTDTLGFLILVPPLRRRVVEAFIARHVVIRGGTPERGGRHDPRIIEGEFRRDDEAP
ncbi:MAG: FxsA family protein [Gammaproteobacteria bacterium]|nr:FxsA family protein [Gammaproteobacteria bacterium]NIO26628.1 FxsA family protein [Gammaproteobacteria bacterium]NIO67181.1 FxsA family protein [Gammaproteobacteria bacterium]NIP47233.1 FxsA family protein [Gammaproteobacteria bacterium]NIP66335.1 FxsA family protein [Gammaproteobacteria bacterium]